MKKTLQIITPCSRPQNLQQIKENIEQTIKVPYDWYIVFDSKSEPIDMSSDNIKTYKNYEYKSAFGNAERNIALKYKDDYEFIYFLDDDNLIHNNFMDAFEDIDDLHSIYIFNQQDRMWPGKNKICQLHHIDTACFLVKSNIVNIEWESETYGADGIFIESLSNNNSVKFIDKDLCLYNALA